MELTKKYFDGKFAELGKKFATKDDLKNFATKSDLKNFATKDDLKMQTEELKAYANEQTDQLAQIIATSVANPLQKHLEEVSIAEEVSLAIFNKMSRMQKRDS